MASVQYWTKRACTAALAVIVGAWPALAHETDQFTLPPHREFADIGRHLNEWAYQRIEDGVRKTNDRIRAASSSSAADSYRTPDAIVRAVNSEFPDAYSVIEGLNKLVESEAMKSKHPGQVVGYSDHLGNIYKNVHFPLDPRQFFRIWHAQTFKAYGTYLGSDKIGHFTDMGNHYYKAYSKAREKGKREEQAMAEAVEVGTHGALFSERGMVGYLSAGAYSNADLVANFLGLQFYRNLTETVMLKDRMVPPMLRQEDGLWVIEPRIRPDSDFFSDFISDHLNEAFNLSHFESGMRSEVRKAVKDRTSMVLARYADHHGNRRPREWFERATEECRTYYGIDYGHLGPAHELVTIANACFERLPADASVTARDFTGNTPLHQAAMDGNLDAVRRLIQRGADVNAQVRSDEPFSSEWGNTPLHYAARGGHVRVAEALVGAGANVNAANDRGQTPLHRALQHREMAALLLERGANASAADAFGRTPLHWAAMDDQAQAVNALLQAGARTDVADHNGQSPLHLAAAFGCESAADRLMTGGASTIAQDRLGITPLHAAATSGSASTVEVLLHDGAPADAADDFGWTPLHAAARHGREDAAELLAGRARNVNIGDAHSVTPLHLAARHGNAGVVAVLLDRGGSSNARSFAGATPLHEAAFTGHPEIVAMLLDHGADAAAKNGRGQTPTDMAVSRRHHEVALMLRNRARPVSIGVRP